MKLLLISLTLKNFKGHTALVINPNGADLSIYGDNATGKTTIADAATWNLFGKDSLGVADFGIKTTINGEVQHNLEHSVEAVYDLDGTPTTFTRTYKEVYTRQRGSSTDTFTGHTTDYQINGVPVQAKEYDERVSRFAPQKLFRTLTDPLFFNQQLDWKARRSALFALIPAISDADVIAASKELKDLPAILGSHAPEDYQKIAKAQQNKINDELKAIPTRIDEALKATPLPAKPSRPIEAIRADLSNAQERKAAANSGGAVASKNVALSEVNAKITELTARINSEVDPAPAIARKKKADAEQNVIAFSRTVRVLESTERDCNAGIEHCGRKRDSFLAEFAAENAKVYAGDSTCPSCQQPLPADKVQSAVDAFHAAKAKKLGEINEEGKTNKALILKFNGDLENVQSELKTARELLAESEATRDSIEIPSETKVDLCADPVYHQLITQRDELLAEIQTLRTDASGEVTRIQLEIDTLTSEIRNAEAYAAAITQQDERAKRVKELEARQKEVGTEYEKLARHLFLIEQFIRAKCNLVTDSINQKFTLARWKLFNTQINGGLEECCEVTIDGVSYSDLNTASRVNVGLDVINALAAHHNFAPPIFVDGCESVTKPLSTIGQQIRLIVSEPDKTLRFETSAPASLFN